tara:strand:- start:285 stop:587 length:303 start_codon:yes stop_codon:yes gene_type:complete
MKLSASDTQDFTFVKHDFIKEFKSLLRCESIEEVVCITDMNQRVFTKILNASNKIGTLYFNNKSVSYSCSLLSINGITLIKDNNPKSESIFIRSSDLVLL